MNGLGNAFDIGSAVAPVDFNTADAATGHRIHLRNYGAVSLVIFKGAGTAGADPVVTVQEHTAATSGTSATLAVVDEFYKKEETALDGDEVWVRVPVTPVSGAVNLGDTSAEQEGIYVIEVRSSSLSAGYEWISINLAATVANAQLISGLYILHDLRVSRRPDGLPQLNA